MAKDNNLNDFFHDLLDEIRAEYNITTLINPQDITKIIQNKGRDKKEYGDVTFFDTDGSVLYSYSWDEFRSLESLPPLPREEEYEGYETYWSHTVEEILEQKNKCNVSCITNRYVLPAFLISVTDNLTISFTVADSSNIRTIQWGDGTSTDAKIGSVTAHTYEKSGVYLVQFMCKLNAINSYTTTINFPIIKFLGAYMQDSSNENQSFRFCNIHRFCGVVTCKSLLDPFYGCSSPLITADCYKTRFYGSLIGELVLKYKSSTATDGILDRYSFNRTEFTRIVIPEGYIEIKDRAFNYSNKLEKIYLPSTIQKLCLGAFTPCNNLKVIDFSSHTSVPQSVWEGVANVRPLCTIVVPDNLYDEWIAATNWSHIADRIVKVSEYTEQ